MLLKLFVVLGLLIAAQPAIAQNTEVYIGPTFVRANPNFTRPDFRFNRETDQFGFNAAVTGYFGKSPVGMTADLGASFSGGADDASLVTLMAGPQVKLRGHRVEPFARGLIGLGRFAARDQQLTLRFNRDTAGMAWGAGGGFDVVVGKHVAIRPLQVDYIGTHILEKNVNYLRASAGITLRF